MRLEFCFRCLSMFLVPRILSLLMLCVRSILSSSPCGRFVRGDINVDDQLRPGDAVSLLEYLFRGAEPPVCLDAADTNDDGRLSLGDAVYLLRWLYLGGPSLTDPSPSVVRSYPLDDCGTDPTEDALDCVSFSRCE